MSASSFKAYNEKTGINLGDFRVLVQRGGVWISEDLVDTCEGYYLAGQEAERERMLRFAEWYNAGVGVPLKASHNVSKAFEYWKEIEGVG